MTSQEIRDGGSKLLDKGAEGRTQIAVLGVLATIATTFIIEIAAQLAEMNELNRGGKER